MRDIFYVIGEYALKNRTPNEAADLASTIGMVGIVIILVAMPIFAVLFGRLFIKRIFHTDDAPEKKE